MTRKLVLVLLACALAVVPGLALAGNVVVARSSELGPYVALEKAFAGAIGQATTSVSLANAGGRTELEKALSAQPSLLLAIGSEAARAASEIKPSCPVIVALVPNPRMAGLAANTPFLPMFVPPARQLKIVRAFLPSVQKLGIIYDPAVSKALAAECQAAATAAKLTLVRKEVSARKDVIGAARELIGEVDAVWLIPDATVIAADTFKFVMVTSLGAKVPVIAFSEGMSKAGAVLAVEADYGEMGVKAAKAAQRLLGGGAEGPEAPEGTIYLNAKSAAMLGLTLSPELRSRAAKIFE
ncbi:MAG: ABC transporter substrate-binding protein [Myxococcales bacterium]